MDNSKQMHLIALELGITGNDTVYREFFASGNFGENDNWKAC